MSNPIDLTENDSITNVLLSLIRLRILHLLFFLNIIFSLRHSAVAPRFKFLQIVMPQFSKCLGPWSTNCNASNITSDQFLTEFKIYISFQYIYVEWFFLLWHFSTCFFLVKHASLVKTSPIYFKLSNSFSSLLISLIPSDSFSSILV